MLNHHILAPACSQNPWRMSAPVFLNTFTSVAVKTTVHPELQNLPMLRKLLVNELIMWQSLVPWGTFGRRIFGMPDGLYAFAIGCVDCSWHCTGGEGVGGSSAMAVVVDCPRVGDGCEVVVVVQFALGWATCGI